MLFQDLMTKGGKYDVLELFGQETEAYVSWKIKNGQMWGFGVGYAKTGVSYASGVGKDTFACVGQQTTAQTNSA